MSFHNGQNMNRSYVTTCTSAAQWYATVYSMLVKEGAACQQIALTHLDACNIWVKWDLVH